MNRLPRTVFALLTALLLQPLVTVWAVESPQTTATEYELKAAFMLNFISYVSWPAETDATTPDEIVVGVLGAHELADNLEQLIRQRRQDAANIRVLRMATTSGVAELQVLFIDRGFTQFADDMLANALANSVLTITETAPWPNNSIINFNLMDERVRFDISLQAAEAAGLTISSRLLQVASQVIGQE